MAVLKMNEILRNDIQEYLDGSESVLIKTITDLTSKFTKGTERVTIPKVSGLALRDVPTGGTAQTAGGMTQTGDELICDQKKEVPEYIEYGDDQDSALRMEDAFLSAAPRVFAEGMESEIATGLNTSAYNDSTADDHEFNSGTANSFGIEDIAKAKKLLDKAKVPKKDRYLAVNADGMEILASMSEFQEGQKALNDEALRQGVVSLVKGFKVVQSEDVASDKVLCYHKSALAFAVHDSVKYIKQEIANEGRTFLSLRGKYGAKQLDGGRRNVVITMAA